MLSYHVKIKLDQVEMKKGELYFIKIPNTDKMFWIQKQYVRFHEPENKTASLQINSNISFRVVDDTYKDIVITETVTAKELVDLLNNKN